MVMVDNKGDLEKETEGMLLAAQSQFKGEFSEVKN